SSHRSFSLTSPSLGYIGAAPISYPSTTTLTTSSNSSDLIITGPLGVQKVFIHPFVRLFHAPPPTPLDEGVLEVLVDDQTQKFHRNMWGTTRTLIANAVEGVSEGYRIPIKMVGVGYRGAMEDAPLPPGVKEEDWIGRKRLNLKLGFSHPVYETIPVGVTVEVPLPTKFVLSGVDKQQLTQFASLIRRWRKPEPYRGK
ncbi:ribosomal protein L6, alpha-beta domain-containing protein, partial [Mrakia frigida]|uniref:mitochondrial 54S ribosomal protein uL6m MRPL6 n=1 Tax=Mrakia frigida TaxID=29902 RepID=UPI003FCC02AF